MAAYRSKASLEMTAEIIQFDNYLRRKRAMERALADEARAEAALPGARREVPLTPETWYDLKQIQHRRDASVSHQTRERVHTALDALLLKLECLKVQNGPNRLDK
jgi:hypothetical protein